VAALATAAKLDWTIIKDLLNDTTVDGVQTFTVKLYDLADSNGNGKTEEEYVYSGNVLDRGLDGGMLSGDYEPVTGAVEIWPFLLRKAWADFKGGWADTRSGHSSDVWVFLRGTDEANNPIEGDRIDDPGETDHEIRHTIFTKLADGHAVGIGTRSQFPNGKTVYTFGEAPNEEVVYRSHGYTIVGTVSDGPGEENVTHFVLFNPWGPRYDLINLPVDALEEVIETIYVFR